MKRDLKWLLSFLYRQGLKPGRYITFLFGITIGSLSAESDPLSFAYWNGPLHFRVAAWTATILLLASLLRLALERSHHNAIGRRQFFDKSDSPCLSDWSIDEHWLPFDRLIEISCAPNLFEPDALGGDVGWQPTDCLIKNLGEFHHAPRLEESYNKWCESCDPRKLSKDGAKYVLVNHPTSETDEHFVRLMVRSTKWSRVQAFLRCITDSPEGRNYLFQTADPDWRQTAKPKMDLTHSNCPHSLCVHCSVVTTDNKLLALQRPGPDRTDYYPNAWSFSFEEQIATTDFSAPGSEIDVSQWLIRAVREEILGSHVETYFKVEDARILSIALEEEIFNPLLIAYIPVTCDSTQLASILPTAPDRAEWLRYDFYDLDLPARQLALAFKTNTHVDGHRLHPTSRYRIYLTLACVIPPSMADVVDVLQNEQ